MANAALKPTSKPRRKPRPEIVRLGIVRDHDAFPDGKNHQLMAELRKFDEIHAPAYRLELNRALRTGPMSSALDLGKFTQALYFFQAANPSAAYHLGIFIAEQMLPYCQYRTAFRKLEADDRCPEVIALCKAYVLTGKWNNLDKVHKLWAELDTSCASEGNRQPYNRYATATVKNLAKHANVVVQDEGIHLYDLLDNLQDAITALPNKAAIDTFIDNVYDKFVGIIERIQDGRELTFDD